MKLATLCTSALVILLTPIPGVRAQSAESSASVLTKVADVPMPGPAVRFDYQAFDATSGRLYIAHMNADQLVSSTFSSGR